MSDFENDVVHLVRLALQGKVDDVAMLARRVLRAVSQRRPDLEQMAAAAFQVAAHSPTRNVAQALPVDLDSRLELLRRDQTPEIPVEPTWPQPVHTEFNQVLQEREREESLADAGIAPTRSLLFVGPPGVGKTLAARWLATRMHLPLLTLDLAAVMSSFLGRTGNNIRVVLDFARRSPAVLLLDEFDAIAKRRDDATEVGELKRLVTVLLQAVDDWPPHGLLIAATNHPELLDPAVWRRFDRVVKFPPPSVDDIKAAVLRLVGSDSDSFDLEALVSLLHGRSFADVTRIITAARRSAIVSQVPLADSITQTICELARSAKLDDKIRVASHLARTGRSQRDISAVIGLSRDTIRKHLGERTTAKRLRDGSTHKED